ncbi:TPA: inverse autotransporter beta domain-containing protein [Providencia alcalifaciens]
MSPSFLTVKQKLANGFVIFTAIWSSIIMPVVPAYAKMLDNKELPSLGSDQIINEDNTERLVAEHTKTVGTFLSQKKTMRDLSEMAQDYARNKVASEATKEIEHWLSKAGNVKLNIDIDKKFSVKNSQFDWLIPWYDQAEFLLFTQHSLHRYDERFHTNNGIGLRHFHEKSTIGMNAFIDHDFSHAHTRAGLGVEYWQDYLKLNANSYFGLTAWKSAPELNHDYNAKPAHGWDIQVEGWLPAYPHLGGNLKYEQYYGDSVALFGKTKRQKNPNAATIGANWTPFPLFTLNASHRLGSEKRSETQAKLQFTWTFGKSLAHHLDPTKVAEARRLSGNRYDFVERNNNIILNYQKKTLLHLSLPTKIQGVTGQSVPLVKSFTGKYPLKHIEWQAPEFLAAGGLISSTDQTATLTLPSYKTSKTAKDTQKINRYRLRATAYDVKDNASPVAETLIEITHSGVVSISPRDMKFHGKGLANGHDVNRLTAIVRDSLGNPVSNAKVVFVLPNTLTLASQKKKSVANSSVQNSLRKKMQAMKISKPWEYIATTDDKGEAQVQFTSQIAGSYEISAYSSNQQPVKAQATFIPDVAQAYIHNFTVSRAGVIADGVSTHSVKAHITDKNKNSIANQEVTFSATHAKIVDKATTDKNGLVEVTLTSLKAGPSEVTLSVNGHSETKTVEFISGKLHQVTILDVPEVYAGRESQVSFQLLDSHGNPIIDAKNDITVIIDKKAVSEAISHTDINNGIYAAKTLGQQPGKHTIQVVMDKLTSPERTFITRDALSVKSATTDGSGPAGALGVIASIEIDINPNRTDFKSGDNPLVIATLKDSFGNEIENIDPKNIHFVNLKGKNLGWRQDGNYDYAINLPLTTIGDIDITTHVNGIYSPKTILTVSRNSGISNIQNVVVTPTNKTPNAGDIPTLTVKLTDNSGNPVNGITQLDVMIGATKHPLPASQNKDGSYTVTLPAQHSGQHDLQVTVNGQPSNTATLTVNTPKPTTTNTTGKAGEQGVLDNLILSSGSLSHLKSGDTLALTVTAQDAFKNPLTGLASTLTLAHQQAGTVTWKDNQDGTYTASLPLTKLGADTLMATVGTIISQAISITVESQNSQKFVTAVKLQTQHPQISAGEKATIILTLHDKYQNGVVQISSNDIKLEDNKLALSNIQWQEQGNGVYSTELPLSQLGNHKLISTVNFIDSPTIDVDVTALRGAIRVHHVSLDATPKQFVVGQKVQLTLTLLDQFNNGVMDVLTNEININDDNTRSSLSGLQWHYQQNGVYIADTIITKGGVHSLKATVNSKQHSVLVHAITSVGQNQVSDALLTTNTASITAGSYATLTLELKDQHGNPVSRVDNTDIVLTNNSGASIPTTWVEMNNLGVYTTKIQLNTVGAQSLTMTVNSISRNIDLHVTSPHGASSVAQLKVSPIKAVEAGQISSLIVAMKDQYGNAVNNVLNRDVAIEIDGVAHSIQLTELGDSGQYTGQLPALLKGQHTVKITVNGQVETSNWTINNPIAISLNSFDKTGQRGALEKMTLRSSKKSLGSGDTATITLNLMDKFDNPLTGASSNLSLLTNLKETSNWQDNHDGSYSIELLMNRLGSQAVQAIVKNVLSNDVVLDISALSGANSVNTTALTIKDAVIEAGDTTELTLALKDSVDNGVINIQDSDIYLTQQNAKLDKKWSSTINGLYTTPLQINQVGVYPLRATVNQQNSRIETIEVTDPTGHTKVANAKLTTNITSLEAGKSVELTLELKDQYNNLVKGVNGVNITLNDSHASETIDSKQIAWRMDSVGIYKASLPLLRTGKHTLQVSVNHQQAQTSEITVNALKGAVNVSKIELTSAKNTISAGQKTTLTLKMQDRFGNEVDNVSVADIELKNTDAQVTTQATWVKVPATLGTYTTDIQLNNVKSHTLIAKVNGQTQTVQIDVTPQKGASHVAVVTLQVPATTEVAEKTKLTLTLTDQFGNNVIAVENQHIELMLGSTRQTVTWIETQDGTYQTDLTLNQVGNHTITVGVNTLSETKSLHVNSPSGKGHVASIQLSVMANPALPNASTKLTLTLKDKYGNGVKDIRSADISLSDSHLPENFVSPTWAEESSQTGVYTALVNLKKVADHTLTANVNNIDETIKVTVQPFTDAQQVNDIELSVDNKNISVDEKVTFTLTTKDIYGNNVSIKAADIQMQNANGALNQPTWTIQGEQHKGELVLSISGDYVITAQVGTKVSSPVKVTVKAGYPVFAAGKSEFSVNSDAIDEGSNTNVVVTLVLKDANGNLIKKKKPRVSANKGTITGTMNEIRDGVYTSNFNNPVIGISTISLDKHSIDYAGTTPTISVVTYGKLEIKTIDYPHTFSVNDEFPHTGFVGAQFQIIVPIGKQTDYKWSVDIDWLSIDEQGIVTMLRKPTPIKNGNAMIPIFKGVPKANTGYKRTVDYRFTLKKWYFYNKGELPGKAAINACQAPSRLIARDDILTSGRRNNVPRKAGEGIFHEWNDIHVQSKLGMRTMAWLADGQTATSPTQILHPYNYAITPVRDIIEKEETICVEDLK